jgi:hypothetical protein
MLTIEVIQGGSAVLRLQIRRADGTLTDLTGAVVTTEVQATGVVMEPASSVTTPDAFSRLITVSGTQTRARVGKQVRVRAYVAPLGSSETVASEAIINVRA